MLILKFLYSYWEKKKGFDSQWAKLAEDFFFKVEWGAIDERLEIWSKEVHNDL